MSTTVSAEQLPYWLVNEDACKLHPGGLEEIFSCQCPSAGGDEGAVLTLNSQRRIPDVGSWSKCVCKEPWSCSALPPCLAQHSHGDLCLVLGAAWEGEVRNSAEAMEVKKAVLISKLGLGMEVVTWLAAVLYLTMSVLNP